MHGATIITSVTIYQPKLRDVPQGRRRYLLLCGRLIPRSFRLHYEDQLDNAVQDNNCCFF